MPKRSNHLFYLYFLVLFWPLAVDLSIPAMPVMAQALSVSTARIQDTILFFTLGFGLGQFMLGAVADSYGRRRVALVGIGLYCISSLSIAYIASSIDIIMWLRLLQGVAASATTVCAYASLRDSVSKDLLAKRVSFLNGAVCFSPALGPIIGSYLTELYGWQGCFWAMSLFSILCFILLFLGFKETGTLNHQGGMMNVRVYARILSHKVFLFYALTALLAMVVLLLYVTTASVWLMSGLGLSMRTFTTWYSINALFNIAGGLLIAPYVLQRYGLYRALVIGLWIVILAGVLMLVQGGSSALMFMLPIFLNSIGYALILSVCYGKVLALFPHSAASAVALFGLIQMAGSAMLLSCTQRISLSIPMLIAMHMLVLLPILVIFMCNKKPLLEVLVEA